MNMRISNTIKKGILALTLVAIITGCSFISTPQAVYGATSSKIVYVNVTAPKNIKASYAASRKAITVSWTKRKEATGYQLQLRNKSKKYLTIKTFTSPNTVKCSINPSALKQKYGAPLHTNVTYSFRIRAYKTYDKENFYTKWNYVNIKLSTLNSSKTVKHTGNAPCASYKLKITIITKAAWDENVLTKAAWNEKIVTKAAWSEYVEYAYFPTDGYKATTEADIIAHSDKLGNQNLPANYTVIYKTIEHPAETKIVYHDATYKTIHHDATSKIVNHKVL